MQTLIRQMTASAALLLSLAVLCSNAQPTEQRLYGLGETIVLSGNAGPGTDYQWFRDATKLENSDRVSGAQSASLTITASNYGDAGLYLLLNTNIILTNGVLASVEVQTNALYEVLVQDQPQIVNFFLLTSGDDITFEVEATGGNLAYQWFWQGQLIPGATDSVLKYENAYSTANAGYYEVVVSNMMGTASSPPPGLLFLKPTPGGNYHGIFLDELAPKVGSSGRLEFNLTSSRKKAFNGKATLLDQVYKFSGEFSDAHHAVVTATSKKSSTSLTLKMQLLTTNQTAFLQGTVSDGTWTSQLRGYLSAFNTNSPPAEFGPHTLALMHTERSGPGEAPNGVSIASADIRMSGRVSTAGRMADGTPFSCSSMVSPTGEWPVYAPLNGNRGCLVGWVQSGSTNTEDAENLPLFWIKQPGPDTYYPNGFNLPLQSLVSAYANGGAALPLEECVASFAYGDLFSPDLAVWSFIKVTQPEPNRLVPEKSTENLQLGVGSAKGFITGKFTDFTTGLRTPIRGVVLQNLGGALGYFLSTNTSGYFSLSADAPVE